MDKVSCYVNSVLQCLLYLSAIRKQLFNCDKSNVLYVNASIWKWNARFEYICSTAIFKKIFFNKHKTRCIWIPHRPVHKI